LPKAVHRYQPGTKKGRRKSGDASYELGFGFGVIATAKELEIAKWALLPRLGSNPHTI
jgi:hypothetical protein